MNNQNDDQMEYMDDYYARRFPIVPLISAIVVVCLLVAAFIPVIIEAVGRANDGKAMQHALEAVSVVSMDQKDGKLTNGTAIRIKDRFFVYSDNAETTLTASEKEPDIVTTVTTATVENHNAVVYLFAADGFDLAYKAQSDITYEKLIDPEDSTIPYYSYTQVNPAAQRFLDEVSYENADDSESKIANYLDQTVRYDRPVGCTVELKAGELTIFDNGTENAYRVTVSEGPYTFYNITPGVGGEFYVKNGDEIVQRGHLRPTGALRMIYSDTPGLQNMRDLGGWPCDGGTIRYNLLIRGGMVVDAVDEDRNTWVKLLGIEHDLFLKTYADSQLQGKEKYSVCSPLGDEITLFQKDLSAEGSENKRNFEQAKEQMGAIMNHLFDNAIAGETTYFHCLAGADRTGMAAIIVEGVLGVSKSDIDRDYELTSFNCLRERNSAGYIADINILRSYPGITFRDQCILYLMDCGVSLEKINAFRRAAIDGNPEELVEEDLSLQPEGANFCVPGGEGWLNPGRCSSTGLDRTDVETCMVTNYFPVQYGDVVYISNLHLSETLFSGIYQSDKTPISGVKMTAAESTGFVKDINLLGDWQFFTVDHEDAGYMRLCGTPKEDNSGIEIHIYRNGEWVD